MSLGDDHPCKVAGVGNIKVRMYDGVIRILTNVKYVSELKKNLISLGYLEKHECAFGSQPGSGCLRITKGALVVMKGRRMANNLYEMEGSMVTDSAEVLAAAQEKQFVYKLWHYRMGHMSNRGLTELGKRGMIPEGMDLSGKKLEMFAWFKFWRVEVEKEIGQPVRYLRSDNGVEYTSSEFKRSPNRKLDGGILEEIWSGKKVELGHLKKCTISRNGIFDEESILKKSGFADEAEKAGQGSSGQHSLVGDISSNSTSKRVSFEIEFGRHVSTHVKDQLGEPSVQKEVQVEPQSFGLRDLVRKIAPHRPKRIIYKPVRYGIDETISYALITANGDPETFEEAMESSERKSWIQAMMEEMQSLENSRTWQLAVYREVLGPLVLNRSSQRKRYEHDNCVYVKDVDEENALYLLLYVDDMLIASKSINAVNELKSALSAEFEMKDLGPSKKILGMEICRDRNKGVLHLSLGGYI
ncbi:uncharacterized protein LOC120106276 [Phoenix dactylifera]|uniref:Uncharacterized protein LOC120106276 n=1 Tax=Phoenix dactylifera TaxID=42345 RepID=A0A8B8ZUG8_PHODC|nr:uncharacterized protein LOC120106276 [Phoenix dactylifera]